MSKCEGEGVGGDREGGREREREGREEIELGKGILGKVNILQIKKQICAVKAVYRRAYGGYMRFSVNGRL